MPPKVAVITGAASGIGLALTQDLVAKGWNVAIGDVNSQRGEELSAELGSAVCFQRTDVSSWEQLAVLFKKAWMTWGRIDFHAANAGIDDKESLHVSTSLNDDDEPSKPDLTVVNVDLLSVFYGVRLATHYFRKNEVKGGKIVVTSSSAGLYALAPLPQYSACKHAVSIAIRCEDLRATGAVGWLTGSPSSLARWTDKGNGPTTACREYHD
jgi:NAD(P)-dependent dehydrogenase (short-subunit alcohol dehydrogenase family)